MKPVPFVRRVLRTRDEAVTILAEVAPPDGSAAPTARERLPEARPPPLALEDKFGFSEFNRRGGDFAVAAAPSSIGCTTAISPSRVRGELWKLRPRLPARPTR